MTVTEALIQLRDDIKEWVTNNLNAIGKPKASDVSLDAIEGLNAGYVQGAVEELNAKHEKYAELLFVSNNVSTANTTETTYDLEDDITNYKNIIVESVNSSGVHGTLTIPVDYITQNYGVANILNGMLSNGNTKYSVFRFMTSKTVKFNRIDSWVDVLIIGE